MTGSTAQLMNGVLLLVTFFCCRIVWGSYMSVAVFKDMWAWVMNTKEPHFLHFLSSEKRHIQEPLLPHQSAMMRFTANETLPVWLMGSYLISNIVLHTLNFYWFAKMITALRKRFSPPLGTRNASQTQKRTKDSAKATKKALLQADEHKAKGVAGAGFGGQTSALDTDATRYRTRRKV